MRILKLDRKEGIARLFLQSLEDLWHLHKILETGDQIQAKTYRKVVIKRGSEIVEGEKKPVLLTIQLEKSEFHQYTGKLRLSGVIISGPEDIQLASHHTITAEPGMQITVKKKWKSYQIERLEKAKVREASIFFVSIDREQADFGLLTEMGLEMRGSVSYQKKEVEEREPFYQKIIDVLGDHEFGRLVICGPGFERENLLGFMKKKAPGLAQKTILEHASIGGKPGIQEIIRSAGSRILKESMVARETNFVEKLLLEISKDGLAVHGKKQVQKAIQYGALDTLLVSDLKVRELESLIDQAEKIAAKIVIVSSEHEAGEQLLGLEGVGGLLRFKLQ